MAVCLCLGFSRGSYLTFFFFFLFFYLFVFLPFGNEFSPMRARSAEGKYTHNITIYRFVVPVSLAYVGANKQTSGFLHSNRYNCPMNTRKCCVLFVYCRSVKSNVVCHSRCVLSYPNRL